MLAKGMYYEDMPNPQLEKLRVHFEGPAVDNHWIDVETLAPVMLGISHLIGTVSSELDHRVQSRVFVSASRKGSFEIDLITAFSLAETVRSTFFNGATSLTVPIVLDALGQVIKLLDDIEGEVPEKIINYGDNADIILNNRGVINIKRTTLNLCNDDATRKSLDKVARGILASQIEKLSIIDDRKKSIEIVRKNAANYLDSDRLKYSNAFSEKTMNLGIGRITLPISKNKTQLFDLAGEGVPMKIRDGKFIAKISSGQSISLKDHVKAKVLVETITTHTGIRQVYEILEVLEVYKGPIEINLPGFEGDSD